MRAARVGAGTVVGVVALFAWILLELESDLSPTPISLLTSLVRVPVLPVSSQERAVCIEIYLHSAILPVPLESIGDGDGNGDGGYWRDGRDDDVVDRHGTRLAAGY